MWYKCWTFKNPIVNSHFYSGVCWLLSSTFDSLFSTSEQLYCLLSPSLPNPIWWIFVGVWATENTLRTDNCVDLSLSSWVPLSPRLLIVKMTIPSNAIYRFNKIPIKLPMTFFTELEQKNLTIHMEIQETPNSHNSLKKEEWGCRNQPSWLQIILQSCNHQDSNVLAQKQKYRPREQHRKPRNKPMQLWMLIFCKGGKNIQWGKDSLFNKWCWVN